MKKLFAISLCFLLVVSCATPSQQGPDPGRGFQSAFMGLAHLILSPIQIAAGLLEGIASIPFFLSANIHEINKGLMNAQAKITLDDTYESAYGKRLKEVPDAGDTGEAFQRMRHASEYFQRVLKRYGVQDADRYILTSIDTANSEGYTLFAVVYRPADSIRIVDKMDKTVVRNLTKEDRLFYEPFETDVNGRPLDTILDWAGLPREYIKTQKSQAVLITLAANSVIDRKRSPDYWENERRWIAGGFRQITEAKGQLIRAKLGV